MKKYWIEHSKDASEQEMLLDENCDNLSENDKNEIFNILPSLQNKDILEVGAGIGRLSKYIAPQCKSLKAVDFIERFIEKVKELFIYNYRIEKKMKNIQIFILN